MAQERRAEGDHGDPPGQTDERARDYSGDLKPNRSLMRRWRAVTLLAAGTVALSLVLWMLHG